MSAEHGTLIHSHFCPNSLPSELNKILGGPREILDPTFCMPSRQDPMEEEQHVDEGSHYLSCWSLMKKNSCNCFQH